MKEVVIVSYARTPMGSFNGGLSSVPCVTLGAVAIKAAVHKLDIYKDFNAEKHVEEVLMGCVLQANLGQAPARQAALQAGLSDHVCCTTINKVCASSMKALAIATANIQVGNNSCIIVGGMENMSQCPHYISNYRKGQSFGNSILLDGINRDGLLDAYSCEPMGIAAELCAHTYNISREQQDQFAIHSFTKAANAWKYSLFNNEVFPVEVIDKKGVKTIFSEDETYKVAQFDKIPKLKPCFKTDGTVTAATSSPLSDGACALILMSAELALQLNIKPLARIISTADAEQKPELFTTSPSLAIPKAIAKAGITMEDIKYFEINEAFAVVSLANMKILGLDQTPHKVNSLGGAVALGHPLGCSGARVVCTLLTSMLNDTTDNNNNNNNNKLMYGCASICNGGGGASAIIIQKL